MEDDLLLFNCIHHFIIQEYLKGMKTSSFKLEFASFRTWTGKYSEAEALVLSSAFGYQSCPVRRQETWVPRSIPTCATSRGEFPSFRTRAAPWSATFVLALKFCFLLVRGLRKWEACASDSFGTLSGQVLFIAHRGISFIRVFFIAGNRFRDQYIFINDGPSCLVKRWQESSSRMSHLNKPDTQA